MCVTRFAVHLGLNGVVSTGVDEQIQVLYSGDVDGSVGFMMNTKSSSKLLM